MNEIKNLSVESHKLVSVLWEYCKNKQEIEELYYIEPILKLLKENIDRLTVLTEEN